MLGPTWAFGQETAVHALRLMGSGLFDQHPGLRIILGHMGEGLPYSMWRIDHRNGWVKARPRYKAKKKICEYFNRNFYLTTSGNFRTQTLIDALLEIGADRILFSADWPFENVDHAAQWFDSATISELAEPFGISLTGMKKHVRVLEEAGLVATEKVGRTRRCSLGPQRLEDIQEWVEMYTRMLDERLDRFGELLERTKGDSR